jgi:hypothetical protein
VCGVLPFVDVLKAYVSNIYAERRTFQRPVSVPSPIVTVDDAVQTALATIAARCIQSEPEAFQGEDILEEGCWLSTFLFLVGWVLADHLERDGPAPDLPAIVNRVMGPILRTSDLELTVRLVGPGLPGRS